MKKDVKKAVALAYGENYNAPIVVANGKEKMALRLIQKAKEFNIPIFKNKQLVESLINLDINEEINEESYLAVAKILSWLQYSESKAFLSN